MVGTNRLRRPLLPLLMAAAIPVLIFAGWIAYQNADEQRRAERAAARETIQRVAERISAEMSAQVRVAETVALSAALDQPDLAMFYGEGQRLIAAHPLWHTIELDDRSGTQLVNLLRPLGVPLGPTADRDSFERVIETGRPVIGGIGPVGPISARRLVTLRVPVMRGGEFRHVLTIAFSPTAIGTILRDAGVPSGWVGAVVDHRGNVLARSVSEEATLGEAASPDVRVAVARAPIGFYRGTTLEGMNVETIYKALPETGNWSVHLGIPSELIDRPVRQSLYALAGGVVASLALAGALAALVSRDITRQRKAERRLAAAALHASEEQAALAIEAAELGTWQWNVTRDRFAASERTMSLLGITRDEAGESEIGSAAFLEAVNEHDRRRVRNAAQQSLGDSGSFEVEFRTQRSGAGARWLRARGRAKHSVVHDGAEILGVVADITEQKRAETERIGLLRRLAQAQEIVQAQIARNLHDQVGQTVTGLSLGLKRLEQALERDGTSRKAEPSELLDQVRWLRGLAGDIGRDIHSAASDLRPTALDDLGLARALTAHAADWSRRHDIAIDVQLVRAEEAPVSPEVGTALYRVVQEALTNILKHAGAHQVSIVLERRLRELRLVVEDDGSGFDPDEVSSRLEARRRADAAAGFSGLGLSGMRERLALIGGTLRIESAHGVGTTLYVQVPLDADTAAEADHA